MTISDDDRGRARPGRPLDRRRDDALLLAVMDVLRERGYERTTVAEVAERARAGKASVYRRWPTKADMVIAAITGTVQRMEVPTESGSLREDLLALVATMTRSVAALGDGLNSLIGELQHNAEFAETFRTTFLQARTDLVRRVFAAARQRGELRADADVELLQEIIPSYIVMQALSGRAPDPDRIRRLIDQVVLPAALPAPGVAGS